MRRRDFCAASLIGALALCLAEPAPAQAPRLKAVATFSILGDFVQNVGGDRIELTTLVGPGGDAHVYTPSPADARRVADAAIVFVNGLGFEGWLSRLIKTSGAKAIVETAKGVTPLKADAEHGHGHDHGGLDPHAWQNVANAKIYVDNIRDALVRLDPAGADVYQANAAAYLAKLDALEREVTSTIERIPPERRKVITSHDAFGYFAKTYGLQFIAPQGGSTDAEASAKDVARIIRQIRREKILAVFLEKVSDPRLIQRIAQESGARVGQELYSDALSPPGGPAGTYIDMVRHNIKALSAALSS